MFVSFLYACVCGCVVVAYYGDAVVVAEATLPSLELPADSTERTRKSMTPEDPLDRMRDVAAVPSKAGSSPRLSLFLHVPRLAR